jgi:hypothetical protein
VGWQHVQSDAKLAWTTFLNLIDGILSPVKAKAQSIVDGIRDIITGLASQMYTWGQNAINMFVKAFQDGGKYVRDAATNLAKAVAGILGFHSPPPEGPLSDADQYMPNMMRMYATGITTHSPLLTNALANAANTARFALTQGMAPAGTLLGGSPSGSTSSGGAGVSVVNVNVGTQQVAQVVLNHITGQMQINGMGRSFH